MSEIKVESMKKKKTGDGYEDAINANNGDKS